MPFVPTSVAAYASVAAPPPPRTHPEWSDIALFALACAAVWWVRRALRRRLPRD